MSPASSLTTTTQYLKFQNFDLGRALEEDNNCRIEVERGGLTLGDEDVEFEEVEDCGADENPGERSGLPNVPYRSSPSHPSNSLCPSFPQSDSLPSTSPRASSKRSRKTAASRRKRATAAQARDAAADLKAHAVRVAQDSTPIELKAFDISSLSTSSNGWTASPTSKLSPGLKKIWKNLDLLSTSNLRLLDWDGVSRIVLLDSSERVIAVLGGVPPASEGQEWDETAEQGNVAVEEFRELSTFTKSQQHGRRGDFAYRTVGFGYGNGRKQPLNYRGFRNARVILFSLRSTYLPFIIAIFNCYAHKTYVEYQTTNEELLRRHPHLRPNFPGTPYAALTVNAGPQSYSPPHKDPDNVVHGWCADTALGKFDPNKGGHLVLWDLGLVIRFPPGSTILFPSSLITHSTIPIQKGETRFAFIQYSSGGLFRWRANGFQSDKDFFSKALGVRG
ncbi:hypothetical protein F5876DRAFT_82570 [Lentinula aff. lateritia]|uniref:Uncharacterized protein n=1 Tax=Lentinula aff. lateritia TaxID=2804960 RepID=A0ACC1TJP5_9AGAR|nr:hypothetical protein F5876DRAFT_82570 [Lentinula aff. lateritia]